MATCKMLILVNFSHLAFPAWAMGLGEEALGLSLMGPFVEAEVLAAVEWTVAEVPPLTRARRTAAAHC